MFVKGLLPYRLAPLVGSLPFPYWQDFQRPPIARRILVRDFPGRNLGNLERGLCGATWTLLVVWHSLSLKYFPFHMQAQESCDLGHEGMLDIFHEKWIPFSA